MEKDLLATLADKNYVDQARQLFSSVYWNAGWRGDYLLLAYDIPEEKLKWFREKGILVKRCESFLYGNLPAGAVCKRIKFYLFETEFKKWQNIVYLDADIIVRASLEDLTKIKGFAAAKDTPFPKLADQIIISKDKGPFRELKRNYSLKSPAFNTGVMVFSTDIIEKETFSKLKRVSEIYKDICGTEEQTILNLFFYKKWREIPCVYNIFPYLLTKGYKIRQEKVKGIVLHFPGAKPWDLKDFFYREWGYNLDRAEQIDLNNIQKPANKWGKKEIKKYCLYLKKKHVTFLMNRYIGLIGIFVKNNFPKLYFKLKTLIK